MFKITVIKFDAEKGEKVTKKTINNTVGDIIKLLYLLEKMDENTCIQINKEYPFN